MARDEYDPQDPRSTRSMRRDQPSTDRLGQGDAAGDPLNPGWRSTRSSGRGRRSGSVPFSGQELALWLQYGGWRFILAGVAILAVAATLYILSQPGPEPLPSVSEEAEPPPLAATLPALATPTVSSITPAPTTAPAAPTGQQLRVTGTGAEGLFLRSDTRREPSTILKTLPESSVVTVIGESRLVDGITWVRVRDETGAEGWAAQDFLQPAQ